MRTRTIEVPLCDLCNRDGILLRVVGISAVFDPFIMSRCNRHLQRLMEEAGVDEVPEVKGSTVLSAMREALVGGAVDKEKPSFDAPSKVQMELLSEVIEEPGLTIGEYANRMGKSISTIAPRMYRLKSKGYVKTDVVARPGRSCRYYPTEKASKLDEGRVADAVPVGKLVMSAPRSAPRSEQLLSLVVQRPGLHPREYKEILGSTKDSVYSAARKLVSWGLLRIEGTRGASRYYPTAKVTRDVAER